MIKSLRMPQQSLCMTQNGIKPGTHVLYFTQVLPKSAFSRTPCEHNKTNETKDL